MFNSSFKEQSALKSKKIKCLPQDATPIKGICDLLLENHNLNKYLSELDEIKYINSKYLANALTVTAFLYLCDLILKKDASASYCRRFLPTVQPAINLLLHFSVRNWDHTHPYYI